MITENENEWHDTDMNLYPPKKYRKNCLKIVKQPRNNIYMTDGER